MEEELNLLGGIIISPVYCIDKGVIDNTRTVGEIDAIGNFDIDKNARVMTWAIGAYLALYAALMMMGINIANWWIEGWVGRVTLR
jgi:hypothetical protein